MFQNSFSFSRRIRRLEYGISYITYIIFIMAIMIFVDILESMDQPIAILIVFCAYIPAIWFLLAQGAKRCHDRGNSGAFQLIPFYGFWMLFADGDIGRNEYGANPKGLIEEFGFPEKEGMQNPDSL